MAEQVQTSEIANAQLANKGIVSSIGNSLVMWMAAGFTMLEAGFVRRRNTAEIVTKNIGLYSIACFMYLLCGFMVMYPGANEGGIIPPYDFSFGTKGQEDFGMNTDLGYADAADFFFQVVFVATAVSIVSGAVAERMNQWAFFALAAFISGVIYPIQGFWNWGSGFLNAAGYSDFAGSGTVHLAGAACALAAAIFIGPRVGKYSNGKVNKLYGANIPIAALGTFILWLGWFGFNGGSQLAVNDASNANAVAQVFLNTNMAAAGGVVAALLVSLIMTGKMDVTMAMNGAIAGLVAITADPLSPSGGMAVLVGAIGGVIVYFSILYLEKSGIDDPVGAISAHGTVGIFGVLAVSVTGGASFVTQLIGVLAIAGFTFIMSYLTTMAINSVMPIRATDEEQDLGLDVSEIGIEAYPEFK